MRWQREKSGRDNGERSKRVEIDSDGELKEREGERRMQSDTPHTEAQ